MFRIALLGALLLGLSAARAILAPRASGNGATSKSAQQAGTQERAIRVGYDIFVSRTCASCHAIRGTPANGRVGPDLTHFAGRLTIAAGVLPNTPANLALWLKAPQQVKPGCGMPDLYLTDDQVSKLVVFLEHLQ